MYYYHNFPFCSLEIKPNDITRVKSTYLAMIVICMEG